MLRVEWRVAGGNDSHGRSSSQGCTVGGGQEEWLYMIRVADAVKQ